MAYVLARPLLRAATAGEAENSWQEFSFTEAETYERQPLQGIYRSQAPLEDNLPFLSRLNLRTVLHLSPEVLIRGVVDWMDEKRVTLYNMGLQVGAPVTKLSLEKKSLAFRSNKRNSAFRPAREKPDFWTNNFFNKDQSLRSKLPMGSKLGIQAWEA